jgi:DNA-binding XRE family transcriptional regulator
MADVPSASLSWGCQEAANGVPSAICGDPLSAVLGRRLRGLRVERGWSRKQVAKRLRVPVAQVGGHERGTRRMEARELAAYARLLRLRISDFFNDPPTTDSA